ncbi:MAG TPA: NGG1p interacting factor NIF3 [bacterium]|nr:NGG1p interacting factor NIF3 [bacterium]HOL46618.1 NGG1p interacting factor NIF3 [bacterium]HPQ17811.1 NGG1p interacting factor NIF3 [bacterium]
MKLKTLYEEAVKIGIQNDLRGEKEINRILEEEKKEFEKLKEDEKLIFDKDRLFNPYTDSRVLYGDLEKDIKKVIVGIDMEVQEVLLTYILNRDNNANIDLIISHHPEGYAYPKLYEMLKIQIDLIIQAGLASSVAENIFSKRISEVEHRLHSVNSERAIDAAKLLNIPFMCIHTIADNCVTKFLNMLFENKKPYRLKELIEILKEIPEYKNSIKKNISPKIFVGSDNNLCGKIFVDMTGGTNGSKDIYEKLADKGISTIVGMHIPEDHIEAVKKANLNVVIAGHIASDNLGLNLLFDEIEKKEKLDFVCVSGFERIKHY